MTDHEYLVKLAEMLAHGQGCMDTPLVTLCSAYLAAMERDAEPVRPVVCPDCGGALLHPGGKCPDAPPPKRDAVEMLGAAYKELGDLGGTHVAHAWREIGSAIALLCAERANVDRGRHKAVVRLRALVHGHKTHDPWLQCTSAMTAKMILEIASDLERR